MLTLDNRHKDRRRLFTVAGVDCRITSHAWLSGPFFFLFGILIALVRQADFPLEATLTRGSIYGLLLYLSNIFHSIGHVLAGKMVGSPGGSILVTATFHVNSHVCDPSICTRWTHIGRSAGGPAATLLLGCLELILHGGPGPEWLSFLGMANVVVGVWLLLPIPRFDGWVIWGELLGFRRRSPE